MISRKHGWTALPVAVVLLLVCAGLTGQTKPDAPKAPDEAANWKLAELQIYNKDLATEEMQAVEAEFQASYVTPKPADTR